MENWYLFWGLYNYSTLNIVEKILELVCKRIQKIWGELTRKNLACCKLGLTGDSGLESENCHSFFVFGFFFFFFFFWWDSEYVRAKQPCSTTWATPPVDFALVILEMGSCELFAWADFEPYPLITAYQAARIYRHELLVPGKKILTGL
jgi:hypothetical protein